MNYTREQLENMSDFELNTAIAKFLGFAPHDYNFDGLVTMHKGYKTTTFDFRDWSDIMPLAVEHKLIINLNLGTAAGVDSKGVTHLCSDYNKPQRAIACCLLMMELK